MGDIKEIQLKEFLEWIKKEIRESEDVLPQLKSTFETSVPKTESRELFFKTKEVEVEVTVGVTKKGKAGIQAWVLQLGGEGESHNTHRIKIKLEAAGYKFPPKPKK